MRFPLEPTILYLSLYTVSTCFSHTPFFFFHFQLCYCFTPFFLFFLAICFLASFPPCPPDHFLPLPPIYLYIFPQKCQPRQHQQRQPSTVYLQNASNTSSSTSKQTHPPYQVSSAQANSSLPSLSQSSTLTPFPSVDRHCLYPRANFQKFSLTQRRRIDPSRSRLSWRGREVNVGAWVVMNSASEAQGCRRSLTRTRRSR